MLEDSVIFGKCPALLSLQRRSDPPPEHLRACVMELCAVLSKAQKEIAELRKELNNATDGIARLGNGFPRGATFGRHKEPPKNTRVLLGDYAELLNKHGPHSDAAESFVREHATNTEFVELARLAKLLKAALLGIP